MNVILTIGVAFGAMALIGVLLSRRSKVVDDSVAEFRRQLGALSPDASRPVIRPQREQVAHDRVDESPGSDLHSNGDDHGA